MKKLSVLLPALVLSLLITSPAFAGWAIQFFPNQATSVSVNINNEYAFTWQSSDGQKIIPVPMKWQGLSEIHVYAAAHPKGQNASIRVLWNGKNCQTMDFDDDEDHDVERC